MEKSIDFKDFLKDSNVTLMGLGTLGRGINDVLFLAKYCGHVTVTDIKNKEDLRTSVEKLSHLENITFVLGEHRLKDFENKDFILEGAGMPIENKYIQHAKENNVPVFSDESLFMYLAPKINLIGVTGTRGKTTTTLMIEKVLKDSGREFFLSGNIRGLASLPLLEKVKEADLVLMELSSWQLQGFHNLKVSPNISVFTNFYDDHLNYYKGNKDLYFKDKSGIFAYQNEDDFLFYGETVPEKIEGKGKKEKITKDYLPLDVKLNIEGDHIKENASFAYRVCEILGIGKDEIKKSLESFKAVEGRLELVREVNGVKFFNDTTATTPVATIQALKTLDNEKSVFIVGGESKDLEVESLVEALKKLSVSPVFLTGSGTDIISSEFPESSVFDNLEDAFNEATGKAENGYNVVLSPGFASFNLFKNEFDRGDQFDKLVEKYD